MTIVYAREQDLPVADYVAVLEAGLMGVKRPLANTARIGEMIRGANFIVTAREDGDILGLARCISDNAWICYCAELAVKETAQGRGIGKGIVDACVAMLQPRIGFLLVAEPNAVGFYERIGMGRVDAAFFHTRADRS